jgi:aspartyl-tRNA synthetase
MTYDDAIRQYGIDKPDLRLPAFTDVRPSFTDDMLNTLGLDPGLPVIALRLPNIGELSRKERDDNKLLFTKRNGPRLLDDLKRLEKSWPDLVPKIREASHAEEKDLLVIIAGAKLADGATPKEQRAAAQLVYTSGGAFRVELARKYADRHGAFKQPGDFRFCWVTDFPMFEWDEQDNRFVAAHHPFTSPHEEDMDKLTTDPAAVRSLAYDIVLNGTELGSGSIRIHRQDIQSIIFRSLGMTDEEASRRFGFFLKALTYGTPPHGGIALGLDRIVMILAGADSLREVIPFPKTAKAIDLMVDAPTPVAKDQLEQLHIEVTKIEEQGKAAGE